MPTIESSRPHYPTGTVYMCWALQCNSVYGRPTDGTVGGQRRRWRAAAALYSLYSTISLVHSLSSFLDMERCPFPGHQASKHCSARATRYVEMISFMDEERRILSMKRWGGVKCRNSSSPHLLHVVFAGLQLLYNCSSGKEWLNRIQHYS